MSNDPYLRLNERVSKLEQQTTPTKRVVAAVKTIGLIALIVAAVIGILLYLLTKGQLEKATASVADLNRQVEAQQQQLKHLEETMAQAQPLADRLAKQDVTHINSVLDAIANRPQDIEALLRGTKISDNFKTINDRTDKLTNAIMGTQGNPGSIKRLADVESSLQALNTKTGQLTTEKVLLAKQVARIYLATTEKQSLPAGGPMQPAIANSTTWFRIISAMATPNVNNLKSEEKDGTVQH